MYNSSFFFNYNGMLQNDCLNWRDLANTYNLQHHVNTVYYI